MEGEGLAVDAGGFREGEGGFDGVVEADEDVGGVDEDVETFELGAWGLVGVGEEIHAVQEWTFVGEALVEHPN